MLWFRIQYLNDLELMILHLTDWIVCFKLYHVFLHLTWYFPNVSIPLKSSLSPHYEIWMLTEAIMFVIEYICVIQCRDRNPFPQRNLNWTLTDHLSDLAQSVICLSLHVQTMKSRKDLSINIILISNQLTLK